MTSSRQIFTAMFLALIILTSCGEVRELKEVHGLAVNFLTALQTQDTAALQRIMPDADWDEKESSFPDSSVTELIKQLKVRKIAGENAFSVNFGNFQAIAVPGENGSWILKPEAVRTQKIDIIPADK